MKTWRVTMLRNSVADGKPAPAGETISVSIGDALALVAAGAAELADPREMRELLDASRANDARLERHRAHPTGGVWQPFTGSFR